MQASAPHLRQIATHVLCKPGAKGPRTGRLQLRAALLPLLSAPAARLAIVGGALPPAPTKQAGVGWRQ